MKATLVYTGRQWLSKKKKRPKTKIKRHTNKQPRPGGEAQRQTLALVHKTLGCIHPWYCPKQHSEKAFTVLAFVLDLMQEPQNPATIF